MIDVSSSIKTGTCTNVTTNNAYLRSMLNAGSTYRGTSYIYPQRKAIELIAECLTELGFDVTVDNTTNYANHLLFNDYSDKVCMQLWNSAASSANLSFLYPRHVSPTLSISGTFNNTTSCRATIRILGEGVGKTKTLLLLGGTAIPTLTNTYGIYFTEAKYLPTGEMKKAVILISGTYYYCYLYDTDWSFLPGFESEIATAATMNSYWYNLAYTNGNRGYTDPFTSYKMFQEQNKFPEFAVASSNGLWEFPNIIYNPYGYVMNEDVSESLKYTLTAGSIYEIGNKKYLCMNAGYQYFLFRVE